MRLFRYGNYKDLFKLPVGMNGKFLLNVPKLMLYYKPFYLKRR